MKKILIDGRFIGVGDSIGRVVFGILDYLLAIDDQHQYSLLICPAGVSQVKERGFWNNPKLTVEVLDIAHYSLLEQTKLLVWLNKKPFDLVYFTQFNHPIMYRRPYIIIIHDLTTFGYFHLENPLKVAVFKKVMKSAVHDSKKIITISKTTKKELLESYKVDGDKIEVIYPGIDDNYLRMAKLDVADRIKLGNKFKKHYQIEADYLLYTGMWKRHKNLLRLLFAVKQISQQSAISSQQKNTASSKLLVANFQLVLVGKIDKSQPDIIEKIESINDHNIEKAKSTDAVFVTGFVPEEFLPSAYAGAMAYVTPSLNEGFGLPPLEAMACGAPVIAGKISATPEVLGDAAVYFDPYDVNDIAEKISKVTSDLSLRISMRKKGFERIKLYSWQENAKKNLEVINKVIGK